MLKNLIVLFCSLSWICLAGCNIRTPEIRGIVLDEETKQPVEGAWVSATLEVKTRTIQGNVYNVLSVDRPHTRTDRQGKFVIPPQKFKKPLPPVGFGAEIENFSVNATTIDDKTGGFYLKDYGGKKKMEVTIYVKPWEKGLREEREYFSYIQSLYKYCFSGRFGIEAPPVEGGCDEWELNLAIAKHERYLDKYRANVERDVNTIIFDELSYLYERKGDPKKAIETLEKSVTLIEKKGLLKFEVWQRNKKTIESRIDQLQEKIKGGQK